MNSKTNFPIYVTLVLVAMKLFGIIGISWIIVFLPLWIPYAIMVAIFILVVVGTLCGVRFSAGTKT